MVHSAGRSWGSEPDSSDSLKSFGAIVKVFRDRAGLTQEALAEQVQYSHPMVASIEQGRRLPPPDFVEKAEVALDAFGVLRAAAQHVGRQPGLANWFREWARLEKEAVSLCTYECRLMPGLLQAETYARAAFDNRLPPLTDSELESQVTARAERQRLLVERPSTSFSFIIEEAI
jgi:transcriptional regulator with XRE-family HTH domain